MSPRDSTSLEKMLNKDRVSSTELSAHFLWTSGNKVLMVVIRLPLFRVLNKVKTRVIFSTRHRDSVGNGYGYSGIGFDLNLFLGWICILTSYF